MQASERPCLFFPSAGNRTICQYTGVLCGPEGLNLYPYVYSPHIILTHITSIRSISFNYSFFTINTVLKLPLHIAVSTSEHVFHIKVTFYHIFHLFYILFYHIFLSHIFKVLMSFFILQNMFSLILLCVLRFIGKSENYPEWSNQMQDDIFCMYTNI